MCCIRIGYNALQYTLQYTCVVYILDATHCNVLHAMHCNARVSCILGAATHCNALQHTCVVYIGVPQCTCVVYIALQCTATHCNTLQHTATHCNTHALYASGRCNAHVLYTCYTRRTAICRRQRAARHICCIHLESLCMWYTLGLQRTCVVHTATHCSAHVLYALGVQCTCFVYTGYSCSTQCPLS